MAQTQSRSVAKRASGVLVMLLGAAIIGLGVHYLAINGTCSSTGYVSYGPVPKCGGGEGLYITGTFFLGPALAFVGWGMTQIDGLLWPIVCVCLAAGLLTIDLAPTAASGAKSFGLVGGVIFAALAVYSVFTTVRKRLRPPPKNVTIPPPPYASSSPVITDAIPPAATVPPVTVPPTATPSADADPLEKIARLAQLRDSGALTESEFEVQKAKLLAQM